MNYIIQGSAADMWKRGIVRCHKELRERNYRSHIVNLVHDENIFDCSRQEVASVVELAQRNMRDPFVEQWVPVETEVEVSYSNWAEKESYVL